MSYVIILLELATFIQILKASCEGIYGFQSPVNIINKVVDSLYSSFDLENPEEDVRLVSVLQNKSQTKFKVLLEVYNVRDESVIYYIGAQSELRQTTSGIQHRITHFVQSETDSDVSQILKTGFGDQDLPVCGSLKSDFIDYYVGNTYAIQWFVKHFQIDGNVNDIVGNRVAAGTSNLAKSSNKNQTPVATGVEKSLNLDKLKYGPTLVNDYGNMEKIAAKSQDRTDVPNINLSSGGSPMVNNTNVSAAQSTNNTNKVSNMEKAQLQDLKDVLAEFKLSNLTDLVLLIKSLTDKVSIIKQTSGKTGSIVPATRNTVQEKSDVPNQLMVLKQQLEDKNTQLEQLKQQNTQTLQDSRNTHKDELDRTKSENQKAIDELRASFEASIMDITKKEDLVIQETANKSRTDIPNMVSQKDTKLVVIESANLNEYIASQSIKIQELQKQLEIKIGDLQSLHKDRLETIAKLQKEAESHLAYMEILKKKELPELSTRKSREIQEILSQKATEIRTLETAILQLQVDMANQVQEYNKIIREKDEALNAALLKQNELLQKFNTHRRTDEIRLIELQKQLEDFIARQKKAGESKMTTSTYTNIQPLTTSMSKSVDPKDNEVGAQHFSTPNQNNNQKYSNILKTGPSNNGDDFYINAISGLEDKLKQQLNSSIVRSLSQKEMYFAQYSVVMKLIDELTSDQRKLIEDYLKELSKIANSKPLSIRMLTPENIVLVLEQIRIQQTKKKQDFDQMKQKLLQDYLDRMNKVDASSINTNMQNNKPASTPVSQTSGPQLTNVIGARSIEINRNSLKPTNVKGLSASTNARSTLLTTKIDRSPVS